MSDFQQIVSFPHPDAHCSNSRAACLPRRGKAEMGHIEVVYVPTMQMLPDPNDLLGNPVPTRMFDIGLENWLRRGVISKRIGEDGGTGGGRRTSWRSTRPRALELISSRRTRGISGRC
jgi:hypothetical protein